MPDNTRTGLGGLIGKLVGTPKDHEEEKAKSEVVGAPEFDITQYSKKLAVSIGLLTAAVAAAMKVFKVDQTSEMVIAGLGVTAAALLGVSLVMAVDLAARAYLTVANGSGKGKAKEAGEESEEDPPGSILIGAPPGMVVWLEGDEEPRSVLAIAGDGGKSSSYLVADGRVVDRRQGSESVKAIDGAPSWHPAEKVRALKPDRKSP